MQFFQKKQAKFVIFFITNCKTIFVENLFGFVETRLAKYQSIQNENKHFVKHNFFFVENQ